VTACFRSASSANRYLSQVLRNTTQDMPVTGLVIVMEWGWSITSQLHRRKYSTAQ